MRHPLRNYFATQDYLMRNWGFSTKKAFLCKIISQLRNTPLAHECHFVAQNLISQPKHSLRNHFVVAKSPFGTRVPFHSPTLPFRNYEMGCENNPWLRNKPSPATISTVTQIPILNFKLLKTISHRSFALRKPPFGAKKEPSHNTISRGPPLITTKKCYFVDLIIMVLSTFE